MCLIHVLLLMRGLPGDISGLDLDLRGPPALIHRPWCCTNATTGRFACSSTSLGTEAKVSTRVSSLVIFFQGLSLGHEWCPLPPAHVAVNVIRW